MGNAIYPGFAHQALGMARELHQGKPWEQIRDNDKIYLVPNPQPEPPEGFIDNTVYRYKLDENGNKVFIGTMDGFPEGWDHPQQFREKGFQKQKEEVKEMPKKDIDFGVIVARVQEVAAERGISLYKASGIVAQETGLHRTTVYNRAKAMEQTPTPEPTQAANQEPEREKEETATQSVAQEEPETYDEICPPQDTTLDEMKLIWIEDVMEHCVTVETKMRYIQAIAELRV
jgi:hypothetical protein